MNKNQVHTLIIPDVHGRTFWKQAILEFPKKEFPKLKIVFLGDYLDPYDFEEISKKSAIDNFKEIIEIAKKDNRIHLLFGNHDMHYWYNARYKCRVDYNNYELIHDLFLENFDLFNVAYEEKIDGVKYLYTHAGVTSFWLCNLHLMGKRGMVNEQVKEEQKPFIKMLKNMTLSAKKLNQMKLNFQGQALLWQASWIRGGDYDCGSCIWADFEEWMYDNSQPKKGIWQIFGHSLAAGGFDSGIVNHDKCIAMLDSRQTWVIDYEGEINKLKDIL